MRSYRENIMYNIIMFMYIIAVPATYLTGNKSVQQYDTYRINSPVHVSVYGLNRIPC